ncbi:MAG: hypothetical protein AAGD33_13350 [Actinomycetota bacterium]
MVRFLISVGIALLTNAIALVVAALVLDDMSLEFSGFIVAVIIFTGVYTLAQPFLTQQALSRASALRGGVALIATLVSLVVTAIVSDSLQIDGLTTWLLAMLIVWIAALIGAWLLPLVLLKRVLDDDDEGGGFEMVNGKRQRR